MRLLLIKRLRLEEFYWLEFLHWLGKKTRRMNRHFPVQHSTPNRSLRISRKAIQKPVKVIAGKEPEKYAEIESSGLFSREQALSMLETFVSEVRSMLTNNTIVTVQTDQAGAQLVLVGSEFSVSLIYTEGGTK